MSATARTGKARPMRPRSRRRPSIWTTTPSSTSVVNGIQKRVGAAENQVMPAFGTNPNVMCYLDDIYIYLKARGADAVPRGRPAKEDAKKSEAYRRGREMRAWARSPGRPRNRADLERRQSALALALLPAPAAAVDTSDLVSKTALPGLCRSREHALLQQGGGGFREPPLPISSPSEARAARSQYEWFPQAIGFVRNTLRVKGKCDVIMGFAQGHELVLNTNHYYTSAYVHRDGGGRRPLAGVDHPRRSAAQGPARSASSRAARPPIPYGPQRVDREVAKPYPLMVDRRHDEPRRTHDRRSSSPARSKPVILWGPIGGPWYAQAGRRAAQGDTAPQGGRRRRGFSTG